jgi:hypothetical protein
LKFHNVLDIETYENNKEFVPYCICLLLGEENLVIYKKDVNENIVETMLDLFEEKKLKETFYVHNLTFDGILIIENLKKKIKFNAVLFKSNLYELNIWSKNFKVKFKCSLKLFPLPLKKIGKLLDKNYEKLEFPHGFVNRNNFSKYMGEHPVLKEIKDWNLKEECIKYCIRDCRIVREMLRIIFQEKYLNENMKARSISSLSLEVFKEHFNNLNLETKLDKKYDKIVREAYFGGRCEIFGNVKEGEKIFHFDFTGMYSEIMKEEFCFGKIKIIKEVGIEKKIEEGFYDVDIVSNDMNIPVLPFRSEEGKLLFPNGVWRGVYWYEELMLFLEEGGKIDKIHKIIKFEKKGRPFVEFVEYFRRLRKKSEFNNVFWKLFINSMYGRMGMEENNVKTEIVDQLKYKRIELKKQIIKEIIINKVIVVTYIEKNDKKDIDSNVCIAAAITSKARIKLYKAYKEVIKNGGRLLYSDTDSVFAAYKRNVIGERHGEIFWDGSKKDTAVDEAIFAIPKGYAIKLENASTVKIKGFRKDSITFEEFERTFKNKKELITKEIHFNKAKFKLKFEEIEKTILLHNYNKRIFNEDKTETKPLVIKGNNGNK